MSCWEWFMKINLCLINALFMVAATLLMGYGTFTIMSSSQLSEFAGKLGAPEQVLATLCVYGAAAGAGLLIHSILGVVAALWTNKCCLYLYYVITLLCLLAEVAFVVLIYKDYIQIEHMEKYTKLSCYINGCAIPPLYYLVAAAAFLQYTASWCSLCLVEKVESEERVYEETAPVCPFDRYEPSTMVYNEHYHSKDQRRKYQ